MELERLRPMAILGEYDIKDLSFKALVDCVLRRIPDEYEHEFPSFSIYQRPFKYCASVDKEGNVFFDVDKLERESCGCKDAKVGVIAHELAHVFLRHHKSKEGGLEHENEADKLASRWGFKKEINAFRQKLGPATLEDI